MKPITTEKRQKEFIKNSSLKNISLISKRSISGSNSVQAQQASIQLKNVKFTGKINRSEIKEIAKQHDFTIGERNYEIRATYENKIGEYKESRTVILDDSEETINVVPNIFIENYYLDKDNYPEFKKMKELTDLEIAQIRKEAKF